MSKVQALPAQERQLDLRGVRCPLTLLKAKLALEALQPGDGLLLLLDPGEAINNLPRSLAELGHKILATEGGDPCRIELKKGEST